MSRSPKTLINGVEYNKTSFGKKWSEITKSNQLNTFLSGDDERFVDEVMRIIPTYNLIKSKGAVRYKVINKKFQSKGVRGVVMISPNSKTEIWLGKEKILNTLFPKSSPTPLHKQTRKDVIAALRQLISPQIKTYKDSVQRQLNGPMGHKVRCSLTGEHVCLGEYHIDHKYPFKNIVEDWCRAIGKDLEHIDVVCRGTKCYLKDNKLAESFYDYHLMNAQLQVTTAKANLSKGSKYYG